MRRFTLLVVLGTGLLAGCSNGESSGEGHDALLPPGFTLLEAPTVADDLAAAMREAGSAAYTVEVSLAGAQGGQVEEHSGVVHWHRGGLEFDLAWRLAGDDGAMVAQGGAVILDDAAYLGEDWVLEYSADAWVRFADDDPDVPPSIRELIDAILEDAAPEMPVALVSTTSQLRPVEVDDGGAGVWYEGVVPTSVSDPTNVRVDGLLGMLAGEEVPEMTYRLLVDEDNVPQEVTAEAVAGGGQLAFTASYRDWGGFDGVQSPAGAVEWRDLASGL